MTLVDKRTEQQLLDKFGQHWTKRIRKGEVSSLDHLEWMAIELFLKWLLKNHRIENKKTKNT